MRPSPEDLTKLRKLIVEKALTLSMAEENVIRFMTSELAEAPSFGGRRLGRAATGVCVRGLATRRAASNNSKPDQYALNSLGEYVRDWIATGELPQ